MVLALFQQIKYNGKIKTALIMILLMIGNIIAHLMKSRKSVQNIIMVAMMGHVKLLIQTGNMKVLVL